MAAIWVNNIGVTNKKGTYYQTSNYYKKYTNAIAYYPCRIGGDDFLHFVAEEFYCFTFSRWLVLCDRHV